MTDSAVPILSLQHIQKTYTTPAGDLTVLKGLNFAISSGETVALVGQSGSGKSTFLHIAGLLDAPTSGVVSVEGRDVTSEKDSILARVRNKAFGFVYQQHHLLKEFTALENVMLPAKFMGMAKEDVEKRAKVLLEKVGLGERLSHLPSQLSGGEQQRCAIARALMNSPNLLLADEPTGNLDAGTSKEITDLLFGLAQEEGLALLLVTHSKDLAKKCARQVTLKNGVLTEA